MRASTRRLRSWLAEHAQDLLHCEATNKATSVAIVDKGWHDDLRVYLSGGGPLPGKVHTAKLMKDKKFDNSLKLGVDYEVIPEKLWDDLAQVFPAGPKIKRHYVKHPETGKPYVLKNVVQVEINKGDRMVHKASEPEWTVEAVKKQFCEALGLPSDEYTFCRPGSLVRLEKSATVEKVQERYPGPWEFKKKIETQRSQVNNSSPRRHKFNLSELTDESPPTKKRSVVSELSNDRLTNRVTSTIRRAESVARTSVSRSPQRRSNSPMPVGFQNLGNTCFFNSAVQCLLRTGPLIDIVLADDFESLLNTGNPQGSKGRIARACRQLLENMCTQKGYYINPSDLHHAVCRKYPLFRDYGQHDSQELLGALLDGLHEDMNQASGKKILSTEADAWENHKARNASPIMDAFHGTLCNSIECPMCGYRSLTRDPFVFLSLPIPQRMMSVSLNDCLAEFVKSETLDSKNKWKCDKCGRHVQATKRMEVQRCADVLIIHLKRFNGYGWASRKVSTPVEYPDILDTSIISASHKSQKYRLIGAVFHSGSLLGGHYTSAAVDRTGEHWYYFNDSQCRKISSSSAHSPSAYILFYQKCQ